MYISKFPGGADATGPGITLGELLPSPYPSYRQKSLQQFRVITHMHLVTVYSRCVLVLQNPPTSISREHRFEDYAPVLEFSEHYAYPPTHSPCLKMRDLEISFSYTIL